MPRQIIDTESSRPAYNRRRIRTFVVIALLVAMVVAGAWLIAGHALFPGNSVR